MANSDNVFELLSPARDASTAIEAIKHGADAVYIGAPTHGARAAATNSINDLAEVVNFAHQFNVKVYVTLNTLVYDDEIEAVETLIRQLYRIGVDALIIQDMGILRMDVPPIALHASTQCDTRDIRKARFLESAGFSQIVLARELSIEQIKEIHAAIKTPLEAFVHGALCVSYSGDCRASLLTTGRSANRGECAQICRYSFNLVDGNGKVLIENKHLLSLKDLNRSAVVAEMIDAGVSSFKIEGRLKDVSYVKNITSHYHNLLNDLGVKRSSSGIVKTSFKPAPEKSFNRGFTDYFATTRSGERPNLNCSIASIHTPKSIGEKVATVKGRRGNAYIVDANCKLNNGDGLIFRNENGEYAGFRLNKIEKNYLLFPASPVAIPRGTLLYRNNDKAFNDTLSKNSSTRFIEVSLVLRSIGNRVILDATDERGNSITVTVEMEGEPTVSDKPQTSIRKTNLEKTGGTIYKVIDTKDLCGNNFIPLSIVSALRRKALESLDRAQRINYRYEYRKPESPDTVYTEKLTFHDNVSNHKAEQFYESHGATQIEKALEVAIPKSREIEVMNTRYCIRREMGKCLLTPEGKNWKGPLKLISCNNEFNLDFDCSKCEMHVKMCRK